MLQEPTLAELNLLHANVCEALGDTKRIMILYALHDRPRNVSTLANDLDTPQPTISRHLRVLRQRSLVAAERDGASVIYRLSDPRIIAILDEMRLVLRDALARQRDALEV
ncbi:MAG: winged helix-turn-helix transcriptional regulator [Anaerolineales bacterium]|nr:winged helix-turn-helix transcriptional regulator [Anaerolineales bacterium]MCB0008504.1 winged helix-turn-helix transcriptional regulator [Anaerolineales bacterium]MCB0013691.1 winged helix-turn-helix transcriptional regulator [Anaerolineales bacterium]MCB0020690.1 winged helix-turn-helix transcriptional regulator [Anaerolineales bacterium]